jgi:hypothetical protein
MGGSGEVADVRGVTEPLRGADLSLVMRLVAAATFVALALTESFEALPAALAAYVTAWFLLRD